jgi:ATP adenylyltransferase
MNYRQLADFIDKSMRMSHVYQPVMLIELLTNGGKLKDCEIAKSLLSHDQSQIEYYTTITNSMVGKVLRNHDIVERDQKTRFFELIDFNTYSDEQIEDLIARCKTRLEDYMQKKGGKIYAHRRKSSGYISGTIRYEILKRSKFHCELCGISAQDKALEVDHIIPRNKGGSDDPSNLQALCYSCNAMKRDRDDTDFRQVRESYELRDKNCIFCNPPKEQLLFESELVYAFKDGFPVTDMHCLVIPKRHVSDYFDLGQAEINASTEMLTKCKEFIMQEDSSVSGFNIGVNAGKVAGQTVMHCHIHLIPRRDGDVDNPIGGVRNTIPGMGDYVGS